MTDESSDAGRPSRQGQGGGRPPFEPTEADFLKVQMLLAMDWTTARVADAIGIDEKTLRKYFRAELREREKMRSRVEGERLASLYASAKAGRITAIRELGRVLGSDEPTYGATPAVAGETLTRVSKMGKKEQDQAAAIEAEAELERQYGAGTRH